MALFLSFIPAFNRSLKNLDPKQIETIKLLLEALEAYFISNCNLAEAQKIAPQFFYKQLRKPFYEAGVDDKLRIVIRRDQSACAAMLVGNHDQIRRFLGNQ